MESMNRDHFTSNREEITTAWVKCGTTATLRKENEQYNIYLCAHFLNLLAYQIHELTEEIKKLRERES